MTRFYFATAFAVLLASSASAKIYTVPAVRMPVVFRAVVPPVAPSLSIVMPTAPIAPTLASILAARGFVFPRR